MAAEERLICAAAALANSSTAVRFTVEYFGEQVPAFVLRYQDRVHAYLNRCGHMPMEMDWREGEFFDFEGRDLICSTHGAMYEAATGKCIGGPCSGTPLVRLRVEERDGKIFYLGSEDD